jgi:hypothetical protein
LDSLQTYNNEPTAVGEDLMLHPTL